jgi:ADP-ribose pyrophosphatase YjhB (NUDIX family)
LQEADVPKVSVFAAIFDKEGRIILVKRNYGKRRWTTPGGGLEAGEDPIAGLKREVKEEIHCEVNVGSLIGIYSTPSLDDLLLFFNATVTEQKIWRPSEELSDMDFFHMNELPDLLHNRTRTRIIDAFNKEASVVRVFKDMTL